MLKKEVNKMAVSENFEYYYNDVRGILQDKTSFQSLKTEEIIQIMQIAATLSLAQEVHTISENYSYTLNN